MTNSFKSKARRFVLSLQFSTGTSKLVKFPEIVKPPPSLGGHYGLDKTMNVISSKFEISRFYFLL
jgi:hypothetical protein